jgi:hypothetical protein
VGVHFSGDIRVVLPGGQLLRLRQAFAPHAGSHGGDMIDSAMLITADP